MVKLVCLSFLIALAILVPSIARAEDKTYEKVGKLVQIDPEKEFEPTVAPM